MFLFPPGKFTLSGYAFKWSFSPGSSGNTDNSFVNDCPGDCTSTWSAAAAGADPAISARHMHMSSWLYFCTAGAGSISGTADAGPIPNTAGAGPISVTTNVDPVFMPAQSTPGRPGDAACATTFVIAAAANVVY